MVEIFRARVLLIPFPLNEIMDSDLPNSEEATVRLIRLHKW